ncbi:hypothetical protein AVEN_51714-1 [Araneus ventricosus]|uniref:Uncharacterized protein n=1 Tax=Araneus ventricosus TaxID=182803 RepID=A0A4Y2GIB2_ARAVE|nr:hypothetical protein AVEN_51714-1 [Araneus ventricosus]
MMKRGGGRDRGRGRSRGRGNASADSGTQATGSSTKNESKSKQEKKLAKNVTEEQKRKMKEVEKSKVSPSAMSTRAKAAKQKKKTDVDCEKPICDKKDVDTLAGNASSEQELGGKEPKAIPEAPTDVLKVESLVATDSVELKELPSKPGHSTDKAFLACASPLPAKIYASSRLSELLQETKQQKIDELKRNLDPIASKVLQVLSLENEKQATETNSEVDVSLPMLLYSKETDKRELSMDLKASKVKEECSSESEKKIAEAKLYEDHFMPMLQCSQDIDKRKLSLDLKTSKAQHEQSSEHENKVADKKFEVDESKPMLQYSKDTDEQKLNSELEALEVQQESSSENESKIDESKTDGKEPMLQCSKDIDERKLNLDQKTSKVQQEVTETKFEVDESTSLLQDSNLTDIKERIQNLDLNASNTKQDISSENQKKLNESETEAHEEIINLRRDVNLCFEFDTLGNKKVLVDNKDQYTADEKQKITFNIGDGNVKLSFIDNKVCIFTQKGEIECSLRKNQVVLSLTDSTIRSESSEGPSANELSHSKDTEVGKDRGSTSITGATNKGSLPPPEEMQHDSGFKNVHTSTLKPDSSLVPRSVTHELLQNITDNFLSSLNASCNNFESDFIKCLNQRNKDTNKE